MLRVGSKVQAGSDKKAVAEVKVCKVCKERIVRLDARGVADLWFHETFLEEGIRPKSLHAARP